MTQIDLDILNQKIHEAVQVIAALREENAALKVQLRDLQRAVRKEEGRGKVNAETSEQLKEIKGELKRLKSERTTVRKKVRVALRKLEGIKVKGKKTEKAQQDLFGSD